LVAAKPPPSPPSPLQFITHCHPELACWQAGVTQWSEGSYFVALISPDNNDPQIHISTLIYNT